MIFGLLVPPPVQAVCCFLLAAALFLVRSSRALERTRHLRTSTVPEAIRSSESRAYAHAIGPAEIEELHAGIL